LANLFIAITALKRQSIPSDLKPLAIFCLHTILTASELKALWKDDAGWTNDIQKLIHQLEK
jgi:hypothetical protein